MKIKKFLVNGEEYYTQDILTLYDVVHYFEYDNLLLVLEYNKSISSKKNWNNILITDQDRIEIISIVGGG